MATCLLACLPDGRTAGLACLPACLSSFRPSLPFSFQPSGLRRPHPSSPTDRPLDGPSPAAAETKRTTRTEAACPVC
ncbi:hypothetical protein BO70DRAFT_364931 [Aspergillus heteromorphus CBS 117.55]|uniref:Uncharacterized protein n=1 Tax=Aspergillus heteromorphus CBS 117.55 TaxID=1448321 RepID=A0A317VDE3_9EURO|nr:uncharacterized protein BO70DRAFT_364931 [Aspergillus heteromorphus CBS 117.55]PWY72394.1 hypothetical protein BO70DRAFT_364931 [Aspergillus heteromorphus CBS 117.55]